MSNLPDGWTDDMNIVVASGRSLEEIVDCVLESKAQGEAPNAIVQNLTEKFGLTQADAERLWTVLAEEWFALPRVVQTTVPRRTRTRSHGSVIRGA